MPSGRIALYDQRKLCGRTEQCFSRIFLKYFYMGWSAERQTHGNHREGAVFSLQQSVDNTASFYAPSPSPPNPAQKNFEHLTYEATPNSATVNKLCFQPAQAHPRIRYRRIHVL